MKKHYRYLIYDKWEQKFCSEGLSIKKHSFKTWATKSNAQSAITHKIRLLWDNEKKQKHYDRYVIQEFKLEPTGVQYDSRGM